MLRGVLWHKLVCFLAFPTADSEFNFLDFAGSTFSHRESSKYFQSFYCHFSSVLEESRVKCMYSGRIYWEYYPSLFQLCEF